MAYNSLTGEGSNYESFTSGLSKLVKGYVDTDIKRYRSVGINVPDVENLSISFGINDSYKGHESSFFRLRYSTPNYEYSTDIPAHSLSSILERRENFADSYWSKLEGKSKPLDAVDRLASSFESISLNILQEQYEVDPKAVDTYLTKSRKEPDRSLEVRGYIRKHEHRAPRGTPEEKIPRLSFDINPKVIDTVIDNRWLGFFNRYEELVSSTGITDANIIAGIQDTRKTKRQLRSESRRDFVDPNSQLGRIYNNESLTTAQKANTVWETIVSEIVRSSDYKPKTPYTTPTLVPNDMTEITGAAASYAPAQHRVNVPPELFVAIVKGQEIEPSELASLAHEVRHSLQFWGMNMDDLIPYTDVSDVHKVVQHRTGLNMFRSSNLQGSHKTYVETALTHYDLHSDEYTEWGRTATRQLETDTFSFQYNWLKETERYERLYGKTYDPDIELSISAKEPKSHTQVNKSSSSTRAKGGFGFPMTGARLEIFEEGIVFLGTHPQDLVMEESTGVIRAKKQDRKPKSNSTDSPWGRSETSLLKGGFGYGVPSIQVIEKPRQPIYDPSRLLSATPPRRRNRVGPVYNKTFIMGGDGSVYLGYGPQQKLLPPARERLVNTTTPIINSTLIPYPSTDTLYTRIQPHELARPYLVPYIDDLRDIQSWAEDRHDYATRLSTPSPQKALPEGKPYPSTSLDQHKYALGFTISSTPKALPPARNTQGLDDIFHIANIQEINRRYDTEHRFRQTYLNEANRKGFITVDVDVLSSTYESKPYVSNQYDIIPDPWETPNKAWSYRPKTKQAAKLDERFKKLNTHIDRRIADWNDPNSILYVHDWDTETPHFYKETPKNYITGFSDIVDNYPNAAPTYSYTATNTTYKPKGSSWRAQNRPTLSSFIEEIEQVFDPYQLHRSHLDYKGKEGYTPPIKFNLPGGDVYEQHGGWPTDKQGQPITVRQQFQNWGRMDYEEAKGFYIDVHAERLAHQMDGVVGLEMSINQFKALGYDTSSMESKVQAQKDRIKTQMYLYGIQDIEPPPIGSSAKDINWDNTKVTEVTDKGKTYKPSERVVGYIERPGYQRTTDDGNVRIIRPTEVILDAPPSIKTPTIIPTITYSVPRTSALVHVPNQPGTAVLLPSNNTIPISPTRPSSSVVPLRTITVSHTVIPDSSSSTHLLGDSSASSLSSTSINNQPVRNIKKFVGVGMDLGVRGFGLGMVMNSLSRPANASSGQQIAPYMVDATQTVGGLMLMAGGTKNKKLSIAGGVLGFLSQSMNTPKEYSSDEYVGLSSLNYLRYVTRGANQIEGVQFFAASMFGLPSEELSILAGADKTNLIVSKPLNPYGLKALNQAGIQGSYSGKEERLLHSKAYNIDNRRAIFDTGTASTFSIPLGTLITGGLSFVTKNKYLKGGIIGGGLITDISNIGPRLSLGPMGIGQTNITYSTNNPQIVRELSTYIKEVQETGIGHGGEYVKGTEESMQSILSLIKESDSPIFIHGAEFTIQGNDNYTSKLKELVKEKVEQGIPVYVSAGGLRQKKTTKESLEELKEIGATILQSSNIPGTNISSDSLLGKSIQSLFSQYIQTEHYNLVFNSKRGILTTKRFNPTSTVEEVGVVIDNLKALNQLKNVHLSRFEADALVKAEYEKATSIRVTELGIDPQLAGLLGDRQSGSLLLNSQMGASFFYSRALYNNLQRQAGYGFRTIDENDVGIATSLYKQAYLANRNKRSFEAVHQDIRDIPFFVQQFDKELLTQGLGGLFNEFISMPLGLGRLYKDEVGFLPSLAGTIGAVLDKTYLYTTGRPISGITIREDKLDGKDQRYKERSTSAGLFETLFTEAFFLAQQSSSAIAFYMIMGEPLNLLISEGLKTEMESLIKVALNHNPKEFSKSTSAVARAYTLGISTSSSSSPLAARLNVTSAIDRTRGIGGFYGDRNLDISPYHIANLFMRQRSGILLDEVMKPFLLDYVNPYTRTHKQSQEGFRNLITELIEEVRRPITLEYELVGRNSNTYQTIIGKRASLTKRLTDIGLKDISAEIIGYQNIRAKVITSIEEAYAQVGKTVPRLANLNDITAVIRNISSSGDKDLISAFKDRVSNIDIREEIRGQDRPNYTSEGQLISSIEFRIRNLGQERASILAQKVQDVLDEIPLNPLRWSIFNKYKIVGFMLGELRFDEEYEGGYERREVEGIIRPKVRTIGDVLSFTELTDITRDLLFGKGGISSFMAEYEVHRPSNAAEPTIKRAVLNTTDKLHTVWNVTIGFTTQAVKRIWNRYFLLMGTPFRNNGLLRSTDALKAMEYNLVNSAGFIEGTRGISWGDDASKVKLKVKELNEEGLRLWNSLYSLVEEEPLTAIGNLRGTVQDEVLEAYLRSGNRTAFLNHYVAINLPKDINPLAKQINVVDSSVVYAMQQVQAVDTDIQARGLGPKTFISVQEHLRNQMIGTFSIANLSGKQLAKRLIKIGPGSTFDSTGKAKKSRYINTIAWTLVTGTLFLESLFSNTSGVSLFSQVGFALTTGGGLLSPLLGNDQGEMNLSTQFAGNTWLPGSGVSRYVLGIITTAGMMGAAHMVGVASLRESIIEYAIQPLVLKRTVGQVGADGSSVDVSIKYKSNSASATGELLLSELVRGEWKDLNHQQIMDRLKKGTINVGGEDLEVTRKDYVFSMNNKLMATVQASVEGGQLVSRALAFRGNAYRNTAIAYAVLSLGSKAALTAAAGTLNYLRDNTGSMDPLLFSGIGAVMGAKLGRSFGGGLLGFFLGGSIGTFMNNVLGQRILSIGTKGTLVNNTQGQIVSELSDFRNKVISNLGSASRAELMAALWAGKLASANALLQREDSSSLVKVQSKQVVLPFLQFFLVTRTKNERRDFQGNITDPGQTYFQIGIQGPPISGMSIGVGLPFKMIQGKGVFGLVANEEYDIGDLMQDGVSISSSIQVAALAFNLLDKGITAGGKIFKRNTGASVNTANQVQRKGIFSLISTVFSDMGGMVEDLGLVLPNTAVRLVTSVPTVEFRLLADIVPTRANLGASNIETPKTIRAVSLVPLAVRALSGAFIGGAIGQIAGITFGASTSTNFNIDDWSNGGVLAGVSLSLLSQAAKAIYIHKLANTPITNNRVISNLGKLNPTNLPRTISKHLGKTPIYAGSIAMGYFLSSSGSGVSVGMDQDFKQQIGVSLTYGLIMGTIATQFSHMGKGMSSTMETYTRMSENINLLSEQLHSGDRPLTKFITQMKLTYSKLRLKGIQKDAEDVIATLINNKAEVDARVAMGNPQARVTIDNTKLKTLTEGISTLNESTPSQILNSQTAKDITRELKDIKGSFLEPRFRNRVFARRLWNTMKVPIVASLIGGIAHSLNPDINVDTFLSNLEGIAPGQEKYRSTLAPGKFNLVDYMRNVAADTFKIIFFQDRDTNSRVTLDKIMRNADEYGGRPDPAQYSKLLSTNKGLLEDIGKIHSDISQMFVLDDTNTFISLGVVGGTFRRKEYGTTMTPYVQLQASSSDVSTAAYSMTSSYLFRSMMSGKNDLLFEVQNAMRIMNQLTKEGRGNDRRMIRLTALRMLSGTAHLQPRAKARRISRISDGVLDAITKDGLLSSILKHRVDMNRNMNYQPYESLISRLLKEQANPSNPYLDKMMTRMLEGKSKGNDITSLFMGDPFFLLSRNFNITNVKFFGKDKRTGEVKANAMNYSSDPGDIWGDYNSPYLDTYIKKDNKDLLDPVMELLSRLFDTLPGPLGFVIKTGGLLSIGIMVVAGLHSLTSFSESRLLAREVSEYFDKDWFGKVNNTNSNELYVWKLRYAHPLPNENTYLQGSSPIIFKGSYQFQLNRAFFSRNVRQAFNEIQEELHSLITKGWGVHYQTSPDGTGPKLKQGYSITDFMMNVKEKEIINILNTFNNLPDTFQDINDGNNSFLYERGKDVHHNLDRIEKAIRDATDEPFKLRLEEEKVKLKGQIDNISGVKGRDRLIGDLTDAYSKEIDQFVDNYLETLAKKEITIHKNFLAFVDPNMTMAEVDRLGLPWDPKTNTVKVSAISLFAVDADIKQLVMVSQTLREDMDKGLDALLELMGDEQKKSFMIGDTANIKLFLKNKARTDIESTIRNYLKNAGNDPQEIIKFLSKLIDGNTPEVTNLTIEVLGSLTGIKGNKDSFFNRMRHHWGGLAKSPGESYKRVIDTVIGVWTNFIRGQSAPPNESVNPSTSSYTAHPYLISHKKGNLDPQEILKMTTDETFIDKVARAQGLKAEREGATSKLIKTGGFLWELYGLANDVLEAMNVFSAFSNLGQSYNNPNMTEAQRLNYAYEAGMVTTNLAFSVGIMTAGVHLGMLGIGALTAGAGTLATIGVPLLAGAAVIGVSLIGYNLLPDKQKTQVKEAINSTYENTGKAIKNVSDFAYQLGSNIGGTTGGSIAATSVTGAMGGAMAGVTTALALGTFSLFSALVLGTTLISAPLLGGIALAGLGVGLVGGAILGALGGGKVINSWMDSLANTKVAGTQIFRPFINRPGDWLATKNIHAPIRGTSTNSSPLEVMTVGQAVQRDYSSMLNASSDSSGSSSASLFISPTVYGGTVGDMNPHMRKYGHISILRPGGVTDPLLDREMRLRGQAFNQTIIGRYTWNKILDSSLNAKEVRRATEAFIRNSQAEQRVKESVQQTKNIVNDLKANELKALTPSPKKALTKEGLTIATNILNIKQKVEEANQAKISKSKPIKVTVDMSNVNDKEREFEKDINVANREVTLISDGNIVKVVPSIESNIKEAVFNPVTTSA